MAPLEIKVATVRPEGIKTKFRDTAYSGLEFPDRIKSRVFGLNKV